MFVREIFKAGASFGRWTVREFLGFESCGAVYQCVCSCGTERKVRGRSLRDGKSTCCGCAGRERLSKRAFKHGRSIGDGTYACWTAMISRCGEVGANTRYHGALGITVCDRWRDSFVAFLEDMGERPTPHHSVDRINNSKGYEPGNCRWATDREQQRNRRDTRRIEFNGVSRPIAEWAEIIGIRHQSIEYRLKAGWPLHEVLSPKRHNAWERRSQA